MENRKAGWKQKLGLFVFSCAVIAALLGAGELYCRLFTGINFLDNSRGLFQPNRYGKSYGNTPNFKGISFGEEFQTDANGFRIDPALPVNAKAGAPAVLLLGDSVAFGPALADDKTIAGNLRRSLSDVRLYNAAAIGYDTFDYRSAATAIVAEKPEIKTVLLVFCLNDVSDASAQLIRSQSGSPVEDADGPVSLPRRINDYLRSRSKLYIWLKSAMMDTQAQYFKNDLANYQIGEQNVNDALRPIADLHHRLAERGVTLKVFVMPYEAQLRDGAPEEYLVPQQLVTKFLTAQGVENYDAGPAFREEPDTQRLFLYSDPMHLSADGARVAAGFICDKLQGCKPQ